MPEAKHSPGGAPKSFVGDHTMNPSHLPSGQEHASDELSKK
jgi:hypothetical protein